MNEKVFKTVNYGAISGIVGGIIMISIGVTLGVLSIVSGARLLSVKKQITF